MTPLDRAIRAGCAEMGGVTPDRKCLYPNCRCRTPDAIRAALAAALADDEATIGAMRKGGKKALGPPNWICDPNAVVSASAPHMLAALRRHLSEGP